MPTPLKKLLFVCVIAVGAMLFGQLYFNGRPISARLSEKVGQPQGYEIVADTKADASYYGQALGRKIPVWFTQARVTVAKWLYPNVGATSKFNKARSTQED